MSELSKGYDPTLVEDKWYAIWLEQGCFRADPARVSSERPAYSIVIPPPNVTGVLTMGHVLNNTIQDILARKARMEGKEVLWLPGTDHAGIATQTVVEKTLKKSGEIRHRNDLGREKFLEKVWQWKEKHGDIIIQQLKKLGASCDWSRERFTMDPEYSRCVQRVFVDLYKKGHIYRGKRMVNWCPASLTALSDEEVVMKEQKGMLYYFKVEVAEQPGVFLTIATTRPETIPGDTAVAVNPKDKRFAHLIGQHIVRPLPTECPPRQKLIPIIGDEYVDFEFGTGVLKVTPAHDKADFEIGRRHHLPVLDIMRPDGTMNDLAGEDLRELERFKARAVAVERLKELGLFEKEEPYANKVGFSERADVPVEPRLSEQWFLKYPCTELSRDSVAQGKMKFYPDRWTKVYDHWLRDIQDWCISRQLWWGHRIPAWKRRKQSAGHDVAESKSEEEIYVGLEAPQGDGWEQDPDVLDTWFSSWLWPFATMGWPEKTETLKKFYPTTDLVTGPDIIFFWVARMIMAGYEYLGEMPFQNVYFTGIIRDRQGRKMSKSLGNSPDPLHLIAQYGADALRFGTMRSAPVGQDVRFDESQVELGRNFCNKLWNAARLRLSQACGRPVASLADLTKTDLSSDDQAMLIRLDATVEKIHASYKDYEFNQIAGQLYELFWTHYCDWYLEASKASLYGSDEKAKAATLAVMDHVLSVTLRLLHPFMPFITEELWDAMKLGNGSIQFAIWPKSMPDQDKKRLGMEDAILEFVKQKYETVTAGRNLRASYNGPGSRKTPFMMMPQGDWSSCALEVAVLRTLLHAEPFELCAVAPKGAVAAVTPLGTLYMPLAGLVDVESETKRLNGQIAKLKKELEHVNAKLADAGFVSRAPKEAVTKHQIRAEQLKEDVEKIRRQIQSLGA